MVISWDFGLWEVLLEFGGHLLTTLLLAWFAALAYSRRHRRPRSSRYFLIALLVGLGEQAWQSQVKLVSNYLPFTLGISFDSLLDHPWFDDVFMAVSLTLQAMVWICVLAAGFIPEAPPDAALCSNGSHRV